MSKKYNTVVILDQVSGYAQIDIINALLPHYQECVLIAGEIKERNKPFPTKAHWKSIIKYDRSSSLKRVLTWLIGTIQMLIKVFLQYRKSRVIAISNPPFSVFVPWLLGCKYDVVIYDIYPDALVNMGYLQEKNVLVQVWSKLNRKVFRSAERIITLSDGMKNVLKNYTDPSKIEVIPSWPFNDNLPSVKKKNNYILNQLGLTDKFIINYSGNFGITHPLEVLVELAAKLDPAKYHVIVAGDGARKSVIQNAINKWKPTNFTLLPWQPADQLHHILSMGDLGVVVLDDTAANISIPSKTYDLLSAGTPLLGICSPSSALSELLTKHKCGQSFSAGEINAIADFIRKSGSDEEYLKTLSANALKASKSYTSDNAKLYV
jgi:glycosyltransferase involved in cell wall biosynthesis